MTSSMSSPLQKEEQEDEQEQDIAGVEAVQLEAPKQLAQS